MDSSWTRAQATLSFLQKCKSWGPSEPGHMSFSLLQSPPLGPWWGAPFSSAAPESELGLPGNLEGADRGRRGIQPLR